MSSFPTFYNPERIGTLFYPDVGAISTEAQNANLSPSSTDKIKMLLILVDLQIDFCHEKGTLYIPGAPEDIRRIIEFIYRNAEMITHISCSLDTHYPFQIFHAAWWINDQGIHPVPYTIISRESIENGIWKPLYKPEWSLEYVEKLEQASKKQLVIWPYHVPIGGIGNTLDPELWSAVFWHSIARHEQPSWWIKGRIPQTEHYSIFQPEIAVSDSPEGDLNKEYIKTLETYDRIFIAGEAMSHCVLETLLDIVSIFKNKLQSFYVLQDCMSAVQHPSIDFEDLALQQFEKLKKEGLNFLNSSDPFPD